MKPLVLTLQHRPDERLDLSSLTPDLLAGKKAADVAKIELRTTRSRVTVGDVFRLRMGEVEHIRIEGASDRLDQIGHGMTRGEILVEGDAGHQVGRLMKGGRVVVTGNVGACAASGMKGGEIQIGGGAGDRLGGPHAGETAGMRGGIVVVRGSVGDRVGDRMRRGTIIVEGVAGAYAGSRMIAGTLILRRKAGPMPGYLMTRGTIVLGDAADEMSPTFVDCGTHDLVAMRLMAAFVKERSPRAASLFRRPLRRYAGDMAVLGKGEILAIDNG